MAALRARPSQVALGGVAAVGIAAVLTYRLRQPPHRLDSGEPAPRPTFSFPYSMLVANQLTVTGSEQINHDTKRITFALPAGDNTTGVPPGAAILTQHTPAGKWIPVFRPYTPIPVPGDSRVLQLLVKKYPNGVASGHMHSLQPGQTLTMRGPLPGYKWQPSTEPTTLLLVAGGAGITPIYSLLKGILNSAEDRTRVQLLWGVNGTRDIILKDELDGLEKQFPDRLRVQYVVSGPEAKPDAPSLGDEQRYRKGYIDHAILKEAIEDAEKGKWGDAKGIKVFLCGPPAMQEGVAGKKGILGELGVARKAIHMF